MSHPNTGFSTATWILLSVTLLISLAIHHTIYYSVMVPGFQTVPQIDRPADEGKAPLELSIEPHHEFREPPLFAEPAAPALNETHGILTTERDDRIAVSGEVFLDEAAGYRLDAIEGGRIEVELPTE